MSEHMIFRQSMSAPKATPTFSTSPNHPLNILSPSQEKLLIFLTIVARISPCRARKLSLIITEPASAVIINVVIFCNFKGIFLIVAYKTLTALLLSIYYFNQQLKLAI